MAAQKVTVFLVTITHMVLAVDANAPELKDFQERFRKKSNTGEFCPYGAGGLICDRTETYCEPQSEACEPRFPKDITSVEDRLNWCVNEVKSGGDARIQEFCIFYVGHSVVQSQSTHVKKQEGFELCPLAGRLCDRNVEFCDPSSGACVKSFPDHVQLLQVQEKKVWCGRQVINQTSPVGVKEFCTYFLGKHGLAPRCSSSDDNHCGVWMVLFWVLLAVVLIVIIVVICIHICFLKKWLCFETERKRSLYRRRLRKALSLDEEIPCASDTQLSTLQGERYSEGQSLVAADAAEAAAATASTSERAATETTASTETTAEMATTAVTTAATTTTAATSTTVATSTTPTSRTTAASVLPMKNQRHQPGSKAVGDQTHNSKTRVNLPETGDSNERHPPQSVTNYNYAGSAVYNAPIYVKGDFVEHRPDRPSPGGEDGNRAPSETTAHNTSSNPAQEADPTSTGHPSDNVDMDLSIRRRNDLGRVTSKQENQGHTGEKVDDAVAVNNNISSEGLSGEQQEPQVTRDLRRKTR